jgi:23S rRNA pseudouridine955/2504/2580 synthase
MGSDDIDKRYLTLLKGRLDQADFLVEQPLEKNSPASGERLVMVSPSGKYAKTQFIQKQTYEDAQLTEVKLYTGRTHQIRVHAQWLGHPVAGDDKYGDRLFNKRLKSLGLKRLFLHAWQLSIAHPYTGDKLQLEAPLPTELQQTLDNLSL